MAFAIVTNPESICFYNIRWIYEADELSRYAAEGHNTVRTLRASHNPGTTVSPV